MTSAAAPHSVLSGAIGCTRVLRHTGIMAAIAAADPTVASRASQLKPIGDRTRIVPPIASIPHDKIGT